MSKNENNEHLNHPTLYPLKNVKIFVPKVHQDICSIDKLVLVLVVLFLEIFTCPVGFFKCPGSFCVEIQYVCDGVAHCHHGEDEHNCGEYT